jgi:hypothetical protein
MGQGREGLWRQGGLRLLRNGQSPAAIQDRNAQGTPTRLGTTWFYNDLLSIAW